MVITPLTPKGLGITVPQEETRNIMPIKYDPSVVLEYARDRSLALNGESISRSGLKSRLAAIYATRSEKVLFLKADADLEFRDVAGLVDDARGVDPACASPSYPKCETNRL